MTMKEIADTLVEQGTLLTYAIFAVAGLSGGCYVAAYAYIRGRKVTPYLIMAYMTIGMIAALLTGILLKVMLNTVLVWEQAFIVGTVVGVGNVLTIAGINFRASVKLPHTGMKANFTLEKDNEDGRNG